MRGGVGWCRWIAAVSGILLCGCANGPTGDRVVLVGIDAATWDVMRPLLEAGRLPTIARLVDSGWHATLRSMDPTISPALWTTIATGFSPAAHGVTGFLAADGHGDPVPVTSNLRRREALWTIAGRRDRRVTVVGWYVTWPVEPVNGVMVSDRFVSAERGELVGGPETLTDEAPGVYPAELTAELEGLFVRADRFIDPYERRFHRMFKAYPVDATRTAIALHLMQRQPADLTLLYLWGIDPIQHHFWKFYEPEAYPGPRPSDEELSLNAGKIPEYYEDVDAMLARLVALMGPRDTVVLVSDHGAGSVTAYDPDSPVSGDHRLDGVIVLAGNHVRRGRGEVPPSILDVAPTVLYLLGVPVGDDMEGRVLREAIDPGFLVAHPPRRVATHEPAARDEPQAALPSAMDERIKERLRSLGYIQ